MKKIKLDNYELKLVIHSLNELRNSLINQNKDFIGNISIFYEKRDLRKSFLRRFYKLDI